MNLNNIIRKALDIAYFHLQYDNLYRFKNDIEHSGDSMFDYLLKPQTGASRFIHKIKESNNIKAIIFLIQETIFPPREKIENKYGPKKTYLLPYYYFKHICFGVIKWFKR